MLCFLQCHTTQCIKDPVFGVTNTPNVAHTPTDSFTAQFFIPNSNVFNVGCVVEVTGDVGCGSNMSAAWSVQHNNWLVCVPGGGMHDGELGLCYMNRYSMTSALRHFDKQVSLRS